MDRRTALDVFGLGELEDLGLANTLGHDVLEERCRQLVERTRSETGGSDHLARQVAQAYIVLKKTNEMISTTDLDRRGQSGIRRVIVDFERARRPEIERGVENHANNDIRPARSTRDDRPRSSKDTWPESWKRATRGFRPYPQ